MRVVCAALMQGERRVLSIGRAVLHISGCSLDDGAEMSANEREGRGESRLCDGENGLERKILKKW
jgi:hypothetical protein